MEEENEPTTKGFMKNLIANLKSDLIADFDEKINRAIGPIKEQNDFLKEKVEKLEKRVQYFENKERMKNLIVHGFEDNNERPRVVRDKVIEAFNNIIRYEETGINFQNAIVFAKRLGKEEGNRPILVEFANPCEKRLMFEWKSELQDKGLRIKNDYSRESRIEYARFKAVRSAIMKKTGEVAFLRGGKIEMKNRGAMTFEEAEKLVGEIRVSQSETPSPVLSDNGKRVRKEPTRREMDKKKKAQSENQMEIDQFYSPQRKK